MMRLRLLALIALISVTAAGCLSHREYRHIYSLDGAADGSTQVGAVAERPVMQLERVLIPDYLDTTDILLRVGAHEIHESTTGRFGERLSLGVTHALRADLASRLPPYTIVLAQSPERPTRQIVVNVDAFDVWPTGRSVLVADWTILGADRKALLSADRGAFTTAAAEVNPGDTAIVTAMADAVRQLADRIAVSVTQGELHGDIEGELTRKRVRYEDADEGGLLPRCVYRSITTSPRGCEQQVSRLPLAGGSRGSGW
jgi:uncharacterized protein